MIKAETLPGELETVHATIAGDSTSSQDVMISGHLFEGYLKQGANDDNSGCALTLEVGRAYTKLVSEGKLPKPKRTIHFLWVPEIAGTNAWLNAHPDVEKRLIADLIDREKWSMLDADVKGNAYEGLLESRPMTACAAIRTTGSTWC